MILWGGLGIELQIIITYICQTKNVFCSSAGHAQRKIMKLDEVSMEGVKMIKSEERFWG